MTTTTMMRSRRERSSSGASNQSQLVGFGERFTKLSSSEESAVSAFLESFDSEQMIQAKMEWIIHDGCILDVQNRKETPFIHLFPREWWITGHFQQDEHQNVLFWIVGAYSKEMKGLSRDEVESRVQRVSQQTHALTGFYPVVWPKYTLLVAEQKPSSVISSWVDECDNELDDKVLVTARTVAVSQSKVKNTTPSASTQMNLPDFYAQKTAGVDVYNVYDAQRRLLGIASIPTMAISRAMYARFERVPLTELVPIGMTVRESNGRTKWIPNI